MTEAVVVASSRTPLAKSFRGSFNMTRPDDLLAHVLKDVLAKVPELDASEVEDVISGCANPERASGSNVARVAALRARTRLRGVLGFDRHRPSLGENSLRGG